jgi:hypothetical protein
VGKGCDKNREAATRAGVSDHHPPSLLSFVDISRYTPYSRVKSIMALTALSGRSTSNTIANLSDPAPSKRSPTGRCGECRVPSTV